jgi:hypothetical protein
MSASVQRLVTGLGLVLTILLAPAAPSFAQITNGGFESTPGFTGWTTDGTNSVVTSTFGKTPPAGTHQAYLSNAPLNPPTDTVDTAAGLETFLGLGAGKISGFTGVANPAYAAKDPTNGSAIKQGSIVAQVGDVLTFQYDFLTGEDPNFPPYYPDYTFLTLSTGTGTGATQVIKEISEAAFATTPTPNSPTLPIYNYLTETGYLPFTYTFTTAGTYTLGFASTQTAGSGIGSALLLDNVALTHAAPEPSTPAVLALGALGLSLCGLRVRRRVKAGTR